MKFHTIDITVIVDQAVVYKDYYWLCKDNDPKQALMFGKSPQCNKLKNILEYSLRSHTKYKKLAEEGYTIVFIQTAYIPANKLFD
jgi:hypothetical protein